MSDDQPYRDVAMSMVLERAFNLAIERTLAHRGNENRSQQEEKKEQPGKQEDKGMSHYDD